MLLLASAEQKPGWSSDELEFQVATYWEGPVRATDLLE